MRTTGLENKVYDAIAQSLREYGYPSATAETVKATHELMAQGKRKLDIETAPDGIVGCFAESQLIEAADRKLIYLD